MQSVSSRIWTRIVVSISYDDNHYTTGTSNELDLLNTYIITFIHTNIYIKWYRTS